jgi:hypothetical protein
MLRDFDIFEVFPDRSTIWRTRVSGQFEVECKLQELAEHSRNKFLAVDIQASEPLTLVLTEKLRQAIQKAANG